MQQDEIPTIYSNITTSNTSTLVHFVCKVQHIYGMQTSFNDTLEASLTAGRNKQ